MTLRYAKLLDDTKRKAFESVIDQGLLVSMLTVRLKIFSIVVNYQKSIEFFMARA